MGSTTPPTSNTAALNELLWGIPAVSYFHSWCKLYDKLLLQFIKSPAAVWEAAGQKCWQICSLWFEKCHSLCLPSLNYMQMTPGHHKLTSCNSTHIRLVSYNSLFCCLWGKHWIAAAHQSSVTASFTAFFSVMFHVMYLKRVTLMCHLFLEAVWPFMT